MNADAGATGEIVVALPEVQMHVVRPTEPVVGIMRKNEICTGKKAAGFVRHIEIDISGTPLEGTFRAGQSFGVVPPGEDERGKPHKVRLYSLASPTGGEDGDGKILSTTVKRVVEEHWDTKELFLGVASNFLCDCKVGDEVMVSGPNGKRFLLPEDTSAHDYIFVATGTGIAPFRGMLRELLEGGVQSSVTMIMGSPYRTDLLYDEWMRELETKHKNFRYLTALSRQPHDDGSPSMYVQGCFKRDFDHLGPVLNSDRALIYICGIVGMELGIFKQLAGLLSADTLQRYLRCDAEALGDVDAWTRRMIHRTITPTRRVFMEVY